jgi:type VI secretion system protein ImpK
MRLSDCFMEIIAYTAFVVRGDTGAPLSYEQVRANMQHLIAQSEACLETGNFTQEDFNLARFAVFAWVDEAILSSAWEGRKQWQREQLQRHYFQTADAGELFFERLNTIGPHQRDVREVYYLCLALGFSGQYCNEGDDFMLEQLRTSNLKLLTGSSMGVPALDKDELFPEAYAQAQPDALPAAAGRGRWPAYVVVFTVGPLALYGVLFLIYRFILSNIGGNLISTVQ